VSLVLALAALLPPADFEKDVLPILSERCFECHRDRAVTGKRPKGGLRLDGKEWILQGGFSGNTVVPGDADASELVRRVSLPADDEDVMPSQGEPLSKEEVETLRRWVDEGAPFGNWTGVASTPPAAKTETDHVPARVLLIRALGSGVAPLSPALVAKAAGDDARIEPAIPESPLLRVSFPAHRAEVDDTRVSELARIASNVVELDLSRTRVTDAGLAAVAEMKRLARLDLEGTAVTDAAVRRVQKLAELRYLNLVGTKVGDAALGEIAKMEKLEAVYLFGSEVSEKGVAELRAKRPSLKVQNERALPEVRPLPETD
jgi:hypothetical protein